jgi:hypothetical protein
LADQKSDAGVLRFLGYLLLKILSGFKQKETLPARRASGPEAKATKISMVPEEKTLFTLLSSVEKTGDLQGFTGF